MSKKTKEIKCDHSKNENFNLTQSCVHMRSVILLILTYRCSVCKKVDILIKEIPLVQEETAISQSFPVPPSGTGGGTPGNVTTGGAVAA